MKPWLCKDFLDTFDSWQTSDWRMFEWGSGGSTLWFAERVDQLRSVEHNKGWYNKVLNELRSRDVSNAKVSLRTDWSSYTKEILRYPGKFDCVMVDGRKRVRCVELAIPRTSSILILDNGMRDRYSRARELLKDSGFVLLKEAIWRQEVDGGKSNRQSNTLIYSRRRK